MLDHEQKSPNLAETGLSENIHQDIANNPYFSMILSNPKCAQFCCEFLESFDDLLNRFCPDHPQAFTGKELDAFVALSNLKNEYRRVA